MLHTTNGAGLSSSSSSESFKVDFGVGKTGPTLIVPDRVPGSRHVNTRVLSNSSVRVEWRTGLQQTLTLSAEQRELYGDDTNVTARNGTTTPLVPMAPLEHFSVNVFVSAHGRPYFLAGSSVNVSCLSDVAATDSSGCSVASAVAEGGMSAAPWAVDASIPSSIVV